MKWPQYVIIIFGLGFLAITAINVVRVLSYWADSDEIEILREEAHLGIFDPTFEYDPNDVGWMAYAAISNNEMEALPFVSVKTALSSRGGKRWRNFGTAFESKQDSILDPAKKAIEIEGVWRYEMPSLVYTPGDEGKEWKLYSYRYFWANDIMLARQTGVIVYKYTSDPLTVPWSDEEWLFSADEFNPPRPYNALVSLKLNTLDESLKDVVAYADPGAFFKEGILYMTLSAFTSVEKPDRLILIASNDFGKSWGYLGNLLEQSDLQKMEGITRFSSAQLIEKDDTPYLLITLGDKIRVGLGSYILPLADLKRAVLGRDENGVVKIIKHFALEADNFSMLGGGQSDYHEKSATGLIMSVMNPYRNSEQPFGMKIKGHEF